MLKVPSLGNYKLVITNFVKFNLIVVCVTDVMLT